MHAYHSGVETSSILTPPYPYLSTYNSPIPSDVFMCNQPGETLINVDLSTITSGTMFMPTYAMKQTCIWNFTVPQNTSVVFNVTRFETERK